MTTILHLIIHKDLLTNIWILVESTYTEATVRIKQEDKLHNKGK